MLAMHNLLSASSEETVGPVAEEATSGTTLGGQEAAVKDNELFIRQAFASDPQFGCELLFRHYYKSLCSHAVRFVYSKSIAEDIVSEVFCQFYLQGTFQKIASSYRAFLYKSVRNSAYNYLRLEAKRTVELDQSYEQGPAAASQQPDSVLHYDELYQQVEAALNSLPPKCRKIYLMHRFEDKKYAEIANELQLSSRTVEVQIRKASQFIKDIISKNWIFFVILASSFS